MSAGESRRERPAGVAIAPVTIDRLLAEYDGVLFDAYGVLVHAAGPLPGAAELLARLNADGRPYFVVTNDASKLPETAAARYRGFGLPLAPERILSSGLLLAPYFAAEGLVGRRCVVLGPRDTERYVASAGGRLVPFHEPFDILVVGDESGFPFLEAADAVLSTLLRTIDDGGDVRLILPNPDLIYPGPGGGFGFAAGSVAAMFEGALALRYPQRADLRFVGLGKPHRPIFDEAIRRAGTPRLVMVGDQLQTDIVGARGAGLDAVWMGTGVTTHIPESLPVELRPTYFLASLEA
jgi:HAD superfamily hydrolase (TIGR01450 family)